MSAKTELALDMGAHEGLSDCSIVIATRDRPQFIVDTVRSIVEGRLLPRELIVVDQSSEANAQLDAFTHPAMDIRVIRSATRGLSAARNVGIAAARCEVIAFTDDDILVDRHWLLRLIMVLTSGAGKTVVVGHIIPGDPEIPGARADSLTPEGKKRVHEGRVWADPLAGGNFAAYRTIFAEIGTFDERLGSGARYPAADDNDMGYRMLEAGYAIVYVPEAVVVHRAWRARVDLKRLQWAYGVGQGAFYGKHLSLRDRWILWRLINDLRHKNPLRRGHGSENLSYSVGVAAGIGRWLLTERLRVRQ